MPEPEKGRPRDGDGSLLGKRAKKKRRDRRHRSKGSVGERGEETGLKLAT